jgi:hypothetical protein
MHFHLADSLSLEEVDLTAAYSPDDAREAKERIHFKLAVSLKNWDFRASHNATDFYDLFGPTKTSRKGQSLHLQYKKTLIFDEPNRFMDYTIQAAGYFNLERMPEYQNIQTTYDRFFSLSFKLNSKYLRRSLGAVEDEKGYEWRLMFANTYVNKVLFPRLYACGDLGIPLPLPHSSIWIRTSAGIAFGDRQEPFANFYFGGFGNNWVDHLGYKRYREYYGFPGVELNEIGGKTYLKLMLEWNLPPLFFRRLGFPFLYANWAGLSLFSSGLMTNIDSRPHREDLVDLGVQLDFRLVALSHHQLTLSFGYARILRNKPTDEWLVSLKI